MQHKKELRLCHCRRRKKGIQKLIFNILKFTEINFGLENNVTINSLMLLLFLE